jgi:hypothetical protein
VEESKFCLFSVVFPVRCISSISPRFYFRRHALCFLPLAAILESLQLILKLTLDPILIQTLTNSIVYLYILLDILCIQITLSTNNSCISFF